MDDTNATYNFVSSIPATSPANVAPKILPIILSNDAAFFNESVRIVPNVTF